MFSLVSRSVASGVLNSKTINPISLVRWASDNPLHEVGPYPRTKEELEKAARKYNLIPEDYEPHEEGECFGDYPKLKPIGVYNRDPYDDYDDFYDCRHFGEVYHADADLYHWERVDPLYHEKGHPSFLLMIAISLGSFGLIPGLIWLENRYKLHVNQVYKIREFQPKDQKYHHFPSSGAHDH